MVTKSLPDAMWTNSTINSDRLFYQFNSETISELKLYLNSLPNNFHVDSHQIDFNKIPMTVSAVNVLRREVDDGQKFIILDSIPGMNAIQIELTHWVVSNILGETIVQNEEGRHLVHIYDRDPKRTIKDGARYHQTHESGAIHTDNVNIPENYQYLLVGCVAPALIGGENIIVSGQSVYQFLLKNSPKDLEVLLKNFTFEYRGISRELYEAPIITFNKLGEPLFRHLRTYMESAHNRACRPLTYEQRHALDALDATLSMSEFQIIYKLKSGQILIANDSQILHDRRCFADGDDYQTFDEYKTSSNELIPIKRTLLRTWVRKI